MRVTIRVVRCGEGVYCAMFTEGRREHRSDAATLHEVVGRLVCEHPDLLQLTITMQDLATHARAKPIPLEPNCWCDGAA